MKIQKIVLVLHNIRSRFNVGAIFRTADAAGIDKIILSGITPAPPHPKINKVALGAEETVPFESHRQTARVINQLKRSKYLIVALEQSSQSIAYTKFRPKYPLAILLGSEVKGLPASLLKICHQTMEIPMHGKKESLNVGIALGIVLFDIIKGKHV